MPAHDETIRDIDAKIRRTEQLLAEAQKWMNLHGTLKNNLDVLKRARTLLEQDEPIPEPGAFTHVASDAEVPAPAERPTDTQPATSISRLILNALSESTESLSLNQITDYIHSKGRADVAQKTVSGVIAQHLVKGTVRRVARGTYELASVNGRVPTIGLKV